MPPDPCGNVTQCNTPFKKSVNCQLQLGNITNYQNYLFESNMLLFQFIKTPNKQCAITLFIGHDERSNTILGLLRTMIHGQPRIFRFFFYRLLQELNQICRYESLKEKRIQDQMSSRFHNPKQFHFFIEKQILLCFLTNRWLIQSPFCREE